MSKGSKLRATTQVKMMPRATDSRSTISKRSKLTRSVVSGGNQGGPQSKSTSTVSKNNKSKEISSKSNQKWKKSHLTTKSNKDTDSYSYKGLKISPQKSSPLKLNALNFNRDSHLLFNQVLSSEGDLEIEKKPKTDLMNRISKAQQLSPKKELSKSPPTF